MCKLAVSIITCTLFPETTCESGLFLVSQRRSRRGPVSLLGFRASLWIGLGLGVRSCFTFAFTFSLFIPFWFLARIPRFVRLTFSISLLGVWIFGTTSTFAFTFLVGFRVPWCTSSLGVLT